MNLISLHELEFPSTPVYLGEGGHGKVERALFRGIPVAVKFWHSNQSEASRKREIQNSHLLQNPYVVKCFGYCKDRECIVTELMDFSLWHFLRRSARISFQADRTLRFRLMDMLVLGLMGIHDRQYLHNDFTSENILLRQQDGLFDLKIGDLGRARHVDDHEFAMCPNVFWAAPEVMHPDSKQRSFSMKNDLYSLGYIFFEMFSFQSPCFEFENRAYSGKQLAKIFREEVCHGYRPPIPFDCPPRVTEIIESCWQPMEQRTISLEYIHEMLQDLIEDTSQESLDPTSSPSPTTPQPQPTVDNNAYSDELEGIEEASPESSESLDSDLIEHNN